jgi:trypsin
MRHCPQRSAFLPVGVFLLAACGSKPPQLGAAIQASSAISYGEPDSGHPAVGMLTFPGGSCSATLIAPSKVLTAAHCLSEATQGSFVVGPDQFHVTEKARFTRVVRNPDYAIELAADIAVVTLETAISDVPPIAVSSAPVDTSILGSPLTVVGFGLTEGGESGTKRKVALAFDLLTEFAIGFSVSENGGRTVDFGDSGGPALLQEGSVETVVGVTSKVTDERGYFTRVDAFASWLATQGVGAADDSDAQVLPCLVSEDTGCPAGRHCRFVLDSGGSQRVACVASSPALENEACDADHVCDRNNGSAIPMLCAPAAPGSSEGVCRDGCWLWGATPCGICVPLAPLVTIGYSAPESTTACNDDSACSPPTAKCSSTASVCVQCVGDADCDADSTCFANKCYLRLDTRCDLGMLPTCSTGVCDYAAQRCVGCRGNDDCALGKACVAGACLEPPRCDLTTSDGCAPATRCTLAAEASGAACVPSTGTATEGKSCSTAADCTAGHTCVTSRCVRVCDSWAADVCGPDNTCISSMVDPPWGVCEHPIAAKATHGCGALPGPGEVNGSAYLLATAIAIAIRATRRARRRPERP